MTAPTFKDYLWAADRPEFWSFCLTYFPDQNVADLITGLPVTEKHGSLSHREISDLVYNQNQEWDPNNQIVGLIEHQNAAIMLEENGFAGSDPRISLPLSADRHQVVSYHYSDGNMANSLTEYYNGQRTRGMYPEDRIEEASASAPEAREELIAMMREVGFDPSVRPTQYPDRHQHNRAATLALMERLTGIAVDPEVN